MPTLFEQWKSFELAVVPIAAPAIQREEMRRAFYAGAVACFGVVMTAVGPDDDEECATNLEVLQQELATFSSDLREVKS